MKNDKFSQNNDTWKRQEVAFEPSFTSAIDPSKLNKCSWYILLNLKLSKIENGSSQWFRFMWSIGGIICNFPPILNNGEDEARPLFSSRE